MKEKNKLERNKKQIKYKEEQKDNLKNYMEWQMKFKI